MRILLLGSTGMMGTAIEDVCKQKGLFCIGLSHQDIEITEAGSLKDTFETHSPDCVINTVALVGIDQCERIPLESFEVNSIAVSYLTRLCQEYGATIVQFSTHAVFDGYKVDSYTEDDSPNPLSVYSVSKYAAECFANACQRHYVVRLPTMFGLRRNKSLGFVDKMIQRMSTGSDVRVAEDRIDSPTYAKDAAEMVLRIVRDGYKYGTYHVANVGRVSYYDFVTKIKELLGFKVNVIRAKDADFKALAHKPLRTALSSVKLPPMRTWDEALKDYLLSELPLQSGAWKVGL